MGEKVTFYPATRIIQIDEVPTLIGNDLVVDIDVKTDLYSDGKEDWLSNTDLNKLIFAMSSVGGNPLPGGKALGATFFLEGGWKIRPYEGSHMLRINGNLYASDGSNPFVPTVGSYNVQIIQTVSSLVDSVVQQLPEIEYASFNGGVSVDTVNGTAGQDYPAGTPQQPVDNMTDAHAIALARGFTTFFVIGDLDIDDSQDYDGHIFVGESQTKSMIDVATSADVIGCEFYDAHVRGTLDGNAKLKSCIIDNLSYIYGVIEQCILAPGTITLGGSSMAHFLDCWSGVPGTGTPIIDMGGSGQALALRNYNGGITLKNKSGPENVSIDLNSGQIILEDTVTAGTIVCRGIGKLIEAVTGDPIPSGNWNGATIINELLNPKVDELHELQGLKAGQPLVITSNSRKTGDINLAITGDGETSTTVTRQ